MFNMCYRVSEVSGNSPSWLSLYFSWVDIENIKCIFCSSRLAEVAHCSSSFRQRTSQGATLVLQRLCLSTLRNMLYVWVIFIFSINMPEHKKFSVTQPLLLQSELLHIVLCVMGSCLVKCGVQAVDP